MATQAELDAWAQARAENPDLTAAELAAKIDATLASQNAPALPSVHISTVPSASNYSPPPVEDIYDADATWQGIIDNLGELPDAPDASQYLIDAPAPVEQRELDVAGIDESRDEFAQMAADAEFVERQVQPEDTVAWQMQQLLDDESAYITQAREAGESYAASRGLLNSSLAAGAAQREAIRAALPIAQQDAATYFKQGLANQDWANQFEMARLNAGLTGMLEMDKMKHTLQAQFEELNARIDMYNSTMEFNVDKYNTTMEYQAAMQEWVTEIARQELLTDYYFRNETLEANVALTLEGIDADVSVAQMNIASAEAISSAQLSADMTSKYLAGVLQIGMDNNSTPEQQSAALDYWYNSFTSSLGSIVNWSTV